VQDDFEFMSVENKVEKNVRELKQLIDAVVQHPTGKRTIEL